MLTDWTKDEVLGSLLNELDTRAQMQNAARQADGEWASRRRDTRHPFRVPCKVRFFPTELSNTMEVEGRTRNLSRNGIGLLIRRMFAIGEPIEVEILTPRRPKMYVAGLVRFCRYVGRGCHEVGVGFKAASGDPLFSGNASKTQELLDWLREA